ncbi:SDR family oxidoreductase [Marinobacterium jannaschii]|uniref:SDR family oxidoreductase n=1 Tax=Marinobacterium jannaschii TaxID=64970 RepID=UPI000484C81B|nr:SDR family oxidoreductase [Marinobacterium jannaschii]
MQKAVLITGCSTGIGLRVASDLKQRGYRVFATARKPSDVDMLANQGFEATQLDLDSSESISTALEWVLARSGGELYALFNNGAYGQPGAVEDLSRDVLRQQFETNVFGWHELTCKVLPVMRKQGYGRIIHNSSVLGLITLKYRGAYNASKFALEGLSDTLRQELAGTAIQVSLIEPGPIESQFRKNAYQKFQENIDSNNSAHKEVYAAVNARLSKTDIERQRDPFTLGPEAVTKCVIHALESKRPKPRYYVTVPTYLFGFLRRVLSTRLLDKVLLKISDDENK